MIQFYSPDIETTLRLSPDESNHCIRVLRHREGDLITVVDGHGFRFNCQLDDTDRKGVAVTILEREQVVPARKASLTIAVAPTKNMDRIDWLVEKLVEIGVDRIAMVECQMSERRVVKVERLERIAVSAMKQSLKATLPEIIGMTTLKVFIDSVRHSEIDKFICWCDDTLERRDLASELTAGKEVAILIGPEGDFTREEVDYALNAGFIPATLGRERLRTETAALYAATAFHVIDTLSDPI